MKIRVLFIYRRLTPSVLLCGYVQLEYLQREGKLEFRAVQEMRMHNSDMEWADIVILGRTDSWYELKLAEGLKRNGKPLLYILDDDLLNIPAELESAKYYLLDETQRNIKRMLQLSDGIISPSALLLKQYASNGRMPIQIEEPAVIPTEYKSHRDRDVVKVGFAGSADRTGDVVKLLKEALTRIKRMYGDRVQFEFFGSEPDFAGDIDARCIPYCDSYMEYKKTLNSLEWDIGLAPLPETRFHACKHYNKFCEYASAGIISVLSEVYPYTLTKRYGGCAVYCRNRTEDWVHALEALIDDGENRERMRRTITEYDIIPSPLC